MQSLSTLGRFAIPILACMSMVACTKQPDQVKPVGQDEAQLPQMLVDFDALDAGRRTDAASARSVEAMGGGQALELQLTPDANWSVVRLLPDQPWDWSGYRDFHFAIDVINPGDESAQLYVTLSNSPGGAISGSRSDTANRSVNVPARSVGTWRPRVNSRYTRRNREPR